MVRSASSSAKMTDSDACGSAAFSKAARTHSLIGCSPASARIRAYSSHVT